MKQNVLRGLLAVATCTMFLWACGGKKSSTGPSEPLSTSSIPVSGQGVPVAAPANPAPGTFSWQPVRNDFGHLDCASGATINPSTGKLVFSGTAQNQTTATYSLYGGVYWSPEPGCDPTTANGSNGLSFSTDIPGSPTQFAAGKDGSFTYVLDAAAALNPYACGRIQVDGALRGSNGDKVGVFGVVLNTGKACDTPPPSPKPSPSPSPSPDCSTIQASLTRVNEDVAAKTVRKTSVSTYPVTVHVSFAMGTAVLNWGDGNTQPVTTGNYTHNYTQPDSPQPPITLHLTVTYNGVICDPTLQVTIPARTLTCDDYPSPHVSLGAAVTSQTATTFTVTSIPVTQTAGVSGSFSPSLPKTVTKPVPPNPAGNIHFVYNWTYSPAEGLACGSGQESKDVSVPPQDVQTSCTIQHQDQAVSGCYKPNPWGNGNNPSIVCGYYGLVPTAKDEVSDGGKTWTLTHDARLAVAHWGGADCGGGAQYYEFLQDAKTGDQIASPGKGGISFVQYCGCPSS